MYIKKMLLASILAFNISNAGSNENSFSININGEDIELFTSIDINSLTYYADGTSYIFDATYLHTKHNNLLSLGISGQNTFQGLEGLSLAFGLKSIVAENFLAFPFYTKAMYRLPLVDSVPTTTVSGSISYAPSVLSFRDARSYAEFRLEVDTEIITNIHIFTGFRRINTNYENIDKTFNNSFYGGIKITF
ncbi:MAG: YfaZ family protein [Sulfurovum sp.]|nr:YfaZ family protein [Sulfurovum sp.]